MQEERQPDGGGDAELRREADALHRARAEVLALVVEAALADGDDRTVGDAVGDDLAQRGGVRRARRRRLGARRRPPPPPPRRRPPPSRARLVAGVEGRRRRTERELDRHGARAVGEKLERARRVDADGAVQPHRPARRALGAHELDRLARLRQAARRHDAPLDARLRISSTARRSAGCCCLPR